MTRKKVKLVWIENERARKSCFRKRRQGLLKKVKELTILCGINAFVIIYDPDDQQPVAWPSRNAIEQLIERFHSAPEMERSKKMMTQENFLKERMAKTQEQLRKQAKKNNEMEMDNLMFRLSQGTRLDEFETSELISFFFMAEEKMKEIQKRIENYEQLQLHQVKENGDNGRRFKEKNNMEDQWIIDMVMNQKKTTEGSSSSIRGERGAANLYYCSDYGLPFPQCEGHGASNVMLTPVNNFDENRIGFSSQVFEGLSFQNFVKDYMGFSHDVFNGGIGGENELGINGKHRQFDWDMRNNSSESYGVGIELPPNNGNSSAGACAGAGADASVGGGSAVGDAELPFGLTNFSSLANNFSP